MVRNYIIEALEFVKEGCKQTLLSCFFSLLNSDFLCAGKKSFVHVFLETVYLSATTLFKKYPEIKMWKAPTAVLDFVNTIWI